MVDEEKSKMKKSEKNEMIDSLVEKLNNNSNFYLTDISGLTVEKTNALRRKCFENQISLHVVKNTLLQKAMEKTDKDYSELYPILKGSTSVMFCEVANAPAKLIKSFRKEPTDKPVLKGAWVGEGVYIGNNQLGALADIKSKEEVIGEIIGLLQSPAKNVISALKSSGGKLAGIVKTLSEKPE